MLSGSRPTSSGIYAARMPRPLVLLMVAVVLSACVQQVDDGATAQGDSGSAQANASSEEFRRALTDCAPILTSVGALDLRRDPELQAVIVSQLRAFAECVRNEGVATFPDPDPAFSGVGSPFSSDEVPFADPAFDEAVATCREALGSAPRRFGRP